MLRCRDDSLYTGIAKDVATRIVQHNSGKGAKYTRGRGPVVLVHLEKALSHGDALRREMEIKQLSPVQKRDLLNGPV